MRRTVFFPGRLFESSLGRAQGEVTTTGGGSLVAANYVYNVAKPNGLTVGMPNQLVYMGQVVGDKEARFDIQKFNWIGSPDRNPTVLFIRADTPYKSIDDVIKAKT